MELDAHNDTNILRFISKHTCRSKDAIEPTSIATFSMARSHSQGVKRLKFSRTSRRWLSISDLEAVVFGSSVFESSSIASVRWATASSREVKRFSNSEVSMP